jgi:hypothetical protein
MSRPIDLSKFVYLILFGEEKKAWSSTLHNFLHPRVTSSPLLRPNVLFTLRPVCVLFDDALYSSVTYVPSNYTTNNDCIITKELEGSGRGLT